MGAEFAKAGGRNFNRRMLTIWTPFTMPHTNDPRFADSLHIQVGSQKLPGFNWHRVEGWLALFAWLDAGAVVIGPNFLEQIDQGSHVQGRS